MSITEAQRQILKATSPMFKEHGKEITSIIYKHMFADHPELLDIFNRTNQKNGTQPFALANTIFLAVENIDHLDVLMPQILLISHKHRASTVRPEHYPILNKCLLIAIDEFLGGMSDPDVLSAWDAAYKILTKVFIDIEKKLYAELGEKHEQDFLPFIIVDKEIVASGPVVAFTLKRNDGGQLRTYHSGQYITLRMKINGLLHTRHYSLTQPFNGETYRIAVRQDSDHEPKGIVSNELINNYQVGDIVKFSLPAGTFGLAENSEHHLFIAGGIGITVLSAMIHDLHQQGKSDLSTLIHCVSREDQAAFANEMREILAEDQYHLLLQSKQLLQDLINQTVTPTTDVYLCGSVPFMNRVEEYLAQCAHPPSQIHVEAYLPSLSLIQDAVKNHPTTKPL